MYDVPRSLLEKKAYFLLAFITDYPVVDHIFNHLKQTFVADKPPPPHMFYQEVLMAAETGGEYFS